jgi:hypothetical protein
MPTPPTPRATRRATTDENAAAAVSRALAATSPIVSMWRDGLSVIALGSSVENRAPDYLTLDQATADAGLDIHEAEAQSVPTVEAITGKASVLILGGDTIIGGAQNRIINITIMLKAASTTAIPVTCLEHGRWNRGGRFTAARPVDHALRSMVAQQVTRRERGPAHPVGSGLEHRFAADQGAVWSEIGQRQARAAVNSPTQALHDVYQREEATVDDFVRAFPMPAGSRGMAIGLFNRLAGLDLFDSTETLERQWPRLVASAASALLDQQRGIDAGVAPRPTHRHLDSGALDRMLARASTALPDATVTPSVGVGRDVRFAAPKVVGTALVHGGRAIHVALFRPA